MKNTLLARSLRWSSRIPLHVLAVALIYATVAPMVHTDEWWVRIFDFPRLQFAVAMVLVLAGYGALRCWMPLSRWEYFLPALIAGCFAWQVYSIVPYTPVAARQVQESRADDESSRISLLIHNVLDENRDVQSLLDLIREVDPDVILLAEPTHWWLEQLAGLVAEYPHTMLQPQENAYGMLLYSRLALLKAEVRFLVEPEIPSIRTGVRLRSGVVVTLYGVHPRPPGIRPPDQEKRDDTDTRDAELLIIAREIEPLENEPVIVAGDFNDVAWSRSTHLFQEIGGLLDPRIGRGLYNTFDAESPVLRYPLDHVFASDHFRLHDMRRLRYIGSDHFPMLVVLDYAADAAAAQDEPEADAGDHEEANEAIEKVR